MSLLVDTSVLIRQQKGDMIVKKGLDELSERYPATPSITFINAFEYLMGVRLWTKSKTEATRFLENFDIINTTEKTPEIMASLRFKYDKKGVQFSLSDLIIASLALENKMTLLTSDRAFRNIDELKLELIE
ncbi:MAG: type II toxin-antitoxin system VapC family toxin [Nitrososphaerales archaeon]